MLAPCAGDGKPDAPRGGHPGAPRTKDHVLCDIPVPSPPTAGAPDAVTRVPTSASHWACFPLGVPAGGCWATVLRPTQRCRRDPHPPPRSPEQTSPVSHGAHTPAASVLGPAGGRWPSRNIPRLLHIPHLCVPAPPPPHVSSPWAATLSFLQPPPRRPAAASTQHRPSQHPAHTRAAPSTHPASTQHRPRQHQAHIWPAPSTHPTRCPATWPAPSTDPGSIEHTSSQHPGYTQLQPSTHPARCPSHTQPAPSTDPASTRHRPDGSTLLPSVFMQVLAPYFMNNIGQVSFPPWVPVISFLKPRSKCMNLKNVGLRW